MKKLLFITLLFCGFAFTAQSQSLTYSKVILLTALDTVPQGKVWKVTNYLPFSNFLPSSTNGSSVSGEISMKVNGTTSILAAARVGHYNSGNSLFLAQIPIWLPAGTTVEPWNNCGSLSIIEFTENNQ
mgnify:CR=1 FL=1|tara:strand:- start:390 stop:773 length:384 start_codon:yes stop_codon:yes gene_type:complete